ncbi:MAG: ATP synthase F0 subunit B [Candidatus Korobacteraceae bacterium]|jgi:F-type H+-transporting ATPase subunit b
MEQTLRQLGELLLGAIPTMVLLLALYGLYHVILHKPLEATLAERRKRTQGAVEQARADIAVAAQRAKDYESQLREARLTIFKATDNRRKQATETRAAAVSHARERAQQQIAQAKAEVEKESAAARVTLQTESDRIANQIIATILQSAGAGPAAVVGGQ